MTHILLEERDDGIAVTASGHAGSAPAGQDIVCAGISALLYGCLTYLRQKQREEGGRVHVEVREAPGRLAFCTSGFADRVDRVALGVTCAGLSDLADTFPAYISVRYRKQQNLNRGEDTKGYE